LLPNDNSFIAHISKETQRYLASRPQRFQFVFVPNHRSLLNLVENMFSKMAQFGFVQVWDKNSGKGFD
jgi:hypothetical protein